MPSGMKVSLQAHHESPPNRGGRSPALHIGKQSTLIICLIAKSLKLALRMQINCCPQAVRETVLLHNFTPVNITGIAWGEGWEGSTLNYSGLAMVELWVSSEVCQCPTVAMSNTTTPWVEEWGLLLITQARGYPSKSMLKRTHCKDRPLVERYGKWS